MPSWVIAVIAVVVLVVLVVVVLVAMRGKGEPAANAATKPPQPAPVPPQPAPVAKMAPAPLPVAPEPAPARPAAAPAPKPVPELRPATLQVEALSPSMTDEAPMLGAEDGELKMGTDELPKFGTDEMPRAATAQMPVLPASGGNYRTPGAKDLAKAIATSICPKCKAPTFVGDEATEDGITYTLNGRCGACGHKAKLIDMKV